ncbi:type 1 fimbrial protein (plasmid) [Hafnia alvei]|uniref:fimbrial protein n=1 Tax=Hafnia alvei TaxID=569 RepID=UPI000B63F21E|nr:fimbrial protein [Hafnia alvei]MBI0278570.1 type 1 fimbrial protein [Hafnia alvei]PNL03868.1 hypothetical protein CEQ28_000170 [Hafnia alvei]
MKEQQLLAAILIVAGLSGGLMSQSVMADGGDGTLNSSGSVIDAACTVAPDSKNMTVEFGTLSLNIYQNDDTYPNGRNAKNITINLTNCPSTIASASMQLLGNTASVTGHPDGGLAVDGGSGAATGVEIRFIDITDSDPLAVNTGILTFPLAEGNNKLQLMAAHYPTTDNVDVTVGTIPRELSTM